MTIGSTYVKGSYWYYKPDENLPIVFASFFGASAIMHAFQSIRYRSWYTLPFVTGCAMICVGFALRAYGTRSNQLQDLGILITSIIMTFSGPPVFAAAQYFLFSRVAYYVPYAAPVNPGHIMPTFLFLDMVCESLIGAGGGQYANAQSDSKRRLGENILKGALILQLFLFIAFNWFVMKFHRAALRSGKVGKWIRIIYSIYISEACIVARCVYRIVEFFEGFTGHLATHEVYVYVFEGALMLVAAVIVNILHPGMYLPHKSTTFLLRDGVTEAEGKGWEDKRPFMKRLLDPFDFAGTLKLLKNRKNGGAGADAEPDEWELARRGTGAMEQGANSRAREVSDASEGKK